MVMNKFFPVSNNNCFAKQKGFKAKFERLIVLSKYWISTKLSFLKEKKK